MTSTCAGASIVSSAAPAREPARKDYYRLCDSWVRARETACFVVWGFPFLFFSFLFGKNLVSTFFATVRATTAARSLFLLLL